LTDEGGTGSDIISLVQTSMIKSVGAEHVLVGHSERRVVFGQSDEQFNKNLLKILDTVSRSSCGGTFRRGRSGFRD
jgi:hypothetical protein